MDNNTKREKFWEELTDSEKIERMRSIIKQKTYFENLVTTLQQQVNELRRSVVYHNHIDGKVVEPISEYPKSNNCGIALNSPNSVGSGLIGKPLSDKEIYF